MPCRRVDLGCDPVVRHRHDPASNAKRAGKLRRDRRERPSRPQPLGAQDVGREVLIPEQKPWFLTVAGDGVERVPCVARDAPAVAPDRRSRPGCTSRYRGPGRYASPYSSKSSAVLTTTVRSPGGSAACKPCAILAPPTPPASATITDHSSPSNPWTSTRPTWSRSVTRSWGANTSRAICSALSGSW